MPRHLDTSRQQATRQRARERRAKISWGVGTLAMGVILAILLRTFVIGAYYVPTGSMLDTIQQGDLVLGERMSLFFTNPEQGDVVTFDSPLTEGETLVKRVIATGGQTIELAGGAVVVDGEVLDEPYVRGQATESLSNLVGSANISYPYTVPEGCVFVMGDNRSNSTDSRYFGPVSVDDVTSRAILIYWPLSSFGPL